MINVLAWIALGALAGWLATRIGRTAWASILSAILVGILGAVIGGVVFALVLPGAFGIAHPHVGSWGVAAFSAVILLFLVRAMTKSLRDALRI